MKGNTKRHLLRADKIFMNIWEIPLLNPGQLISSDWINFFFLPSVTLNILTVIHLFYEYEFISAFLSFAFFACLHIFNLKLWHLFPFGILWKHIAQIRLYLWEQSLENENDEVISADTSALWLPLHSCCSSTNMDDHNLDKKLQPALYPSIQHGAVALGGSVSPW